MFAHSGSWDQVHFCWKALPFEDGDQICDFPALRAFGFRPSGIFFACSMVLNRLASAGIERRTSLMCLMRRWWTSCTSTSGPGFWQQTIGAASKKWGTSGCSKQFQGMRSEKSVWAIAMQMAWLGQIVLNRQSCCYVARLVDGLMRLRGPITKVDVIALRPLLRKLSTLQMFLQWESFAQQRPWRTARTMCVRTWLDGARYLAFLLQSNSWIIQYFRLPN